MKSYHISGPELFKGMIRYCSEQGIYCRYYKSDDGTGGCLMSVYGTPNEIAMVECQFPELKIIRGEK